MLHIDHPTPVVDYWLTLQSNEIDSKPGSYQDRFYAESQPKYLGLDGVDSGLIRQECVLVDRGKNAEILRRDPSIRTGFFCYFHDFLRILLLFYGFSKDFFAFSMIFFVLSRIFKDSFAFFSPKVSVHWVHRLYQIHGSEYNNTNRVKWIKEKSIQLPEAISSMRGGNPSSEPPTTEKPKRRSLGPRRTITTSGSSSTSSDALESWINHHYSWLSFIIHHFYLSLISIRSYIGHRQGPDLYAFIGFIGFIGPGDDDLNWLLILKCDHIMCNTFYRKMFNTYNLYHQGL